LRSYDGDIRFVMAVDTVANIVYLGLSLVGALSPSCGLGRKI
jgi:hypothetical protein